MVKEKVLGFREKDSEEVEQLLESFSCSVLCYSCWRKFLDVENRPELAKRFYKWFNGEYSNNEQAIQRIIKRIEKDVYHKGKLVPVVSVEELEKWCKEHQTGLEDICEGFSPVEWKYFKTKLINKKDLLSWVRKRGG